MTKQLLVALLAVFASQEAPDVAIGQGLSSFPRQRTSVYPDLAPEAFKLRKRHVITPPSPEALLVEPSFEAKEGSENFQYQVRVANAMNAADLLPPVVRLAHYVDNTPLSLRKRLVAWRGTLMAVEPTNMGMIVTVRVGCEMDTLYDSYSVIEYYRIDRGVITFLRAELPPPNSQRIWVGP